MRKTFSNFLIFATGAAIGSVVTWKIVKTKYEQIANEEIASVKEVYSRDHYTRTEPVEEETEEEPDTEPTEELKNKVEELGYINYSTKKEEKEEKQMSMDDISVPYIITPEEFGEFDDYQTVSLTYYADGYLADDMDNLVEDADFIIGDDWQNHFGEYEDDSVFVRNDELQTDYEILLSLRKYSELSPQ